MFGAGAQNLDQMASDGFSSMQDNASMGQAQLQGNDNAAPGQITD